MALEAGVVYIEDLVATNPVGATDNVDEGDDHIRNIKTAVKGSFPNLGAAAVTASAPELNYVDVAAAGTAEASKALVLDGSLDVTGINSLTATALVGDLTGDVIGDVTGNTDTATSVAANAIDATALDTSGLTRSTAQTIALSGTWVVPEGLWMVVITAATSFPDFQIKDSGGTWRSTLGTIAGAMCVLSDGTNCRYVEGGAGAVTYYTARLPT